MQPATLDGIALFGAAVTMNTVDHPRALQINHYFGLNGEEVIDGGSTGFETEVTGAHFGLSNGDTSGNTGRANLGAAQDAVRSFNDGNGHTLVDTLGRTWQNVWVGPLKPRPPIRIDLGGNAYQSYSLQLLHF